MKRTAECKRLKQFIKELKKLHKDGAGLITMKILTHRQYCELRDEAAKVPSLEAKINPGYSEYNKMSINQLRIIITDAVNEIKKRTQEM